MNQNDQLKFKEVMAGLSEMYNKPISDSLLKMYWGAFKSIDIGQFQSAINAHMMNPDSGQYFPKLADITKQLAGNAEQNEQALAGEAEMAWSEVLSSISKLGPYRSLQLENKISLAAVKNIGGWAYICEATFSELVWIKKDFINFYQTLHTVPLERLPSSLPGLEEIADARAKSKIGFNQMLAKLAKDLE